MESGSAIAADDDDLTEGKTTGDVEGGSSGGDVFQRGVKVGGDLYEQR